MDKEVSEKIIGCAFLVYKNMGFGFLESVYEKCLLIELNRIGLIVENQVSIDVTYSDIPVGHFVADILVNREIIVELKSVSRLNKAHEVQLVNYLTATGIDSGLLINFGETGVEIKRKFRRHSNVL